MINTIKRFSLYCAQYILSPPTIGFITTQLRYFCCGIFSLKSFDYKYLRFTLSGLLLEKLFTYMHNIVKNKFESFKDSFLEDFLKINNASDFYWLISYIHLVLRVHINNMQKFLGYIILSTFFTGPLITACLWYIFFLSLGFVYIIDFTYCYSNNNTIKTKYPLLNIFVTIVLAGLLLIIVYLIIENMNVILDITMHELNKILLDFILKMISVRPRGPQDNTYHGDLGDKSSGGGPAPAGGGGQDPGKGPGGNKGPGCGPDKVNDYPSEEESSSLSELESDLSELNSEDFSEQDSTLSELNSEDFSGQKDTKKKKIQPLKK